MLVEASYHDEVRIAVVNENSELENFEIESKHKSNTKGNIYLAKVLRVEPALQAVFVDYGHTKQGFLSFSNIHPDYYQIPVADRQNTENKKAENDDFANLEQAIQESQQALKALNSDQPLNVEDVVPDTDDIQNDEEKGEISTETPPEYKKYKVQDVIKPRQMLLVQVEKEERGNKCAALTTYIALAGRYCILMPNSGNKSGISKKITNQKTRTRIKKILDEINEEGNFNVVIRTAGEKKTKTDIKKDYDFLIKTWTEIKDRTIKTVNPALIYKESCLIKRSLRDLYSKDVKEIMVAGEESYKIAKDFMGTLLPSHARRIKLYKESTPLFTKYGIERQVDSAYSSRVQLPSGGYIIINPTEALVSIDVNSGRATKERNIEETAISTNIEAAKEIAKQIMIRNMSGLIVIDFIDMVSHANNMTVEKLLKSYFKHDRAKVQISKMSKLGLIEISRQRLRPSMAETFFSCCPLCEGFGLVNDPSFAALRIIRAINNYVLTRHPKGTVTVSLHFEILSFIFNHYKKQLLEIEESFGGRIDLIHDKSVSYNDYKIEMSYADEQEKRSEQKNKGKFSKYPNAQKPMNRKSKERKENQKNDQENKNNRDKKYQNKKNSTKFKNKKPFSIVKPAQTIIEEIYDSSKPDTSLANTEAMNKAPLDTENASTQEQKPSNHKQKQKKSKLQENKKIDIVDLSTNASEPKTDSAAPSASAPAMTAPADNAQNTPENKQNSQNIEKKSTKKKPQQKKEPKPQTEPAENPAQKTQKKSDKVEKKAQTQEEKKEKKSTKPQQKKEKKPAQQKTTEGKAESKAENPKPPKKEETKTVKEAQPKELKNTEVPPQKESVEEKPKKRGWWDKLINK